MDFEIHFIDDGNTTLMEDEILNSVNDFTFTIDTSAVSVDGRAAGVCLYVDSVGHNLIG